MNSPARTHFIATERKALQTVTTAGDDLIVEGWAARFTGLDREGEQFTEDAFSEAIARAKAGTIPLAYHHKHDAILGRVLELRVVRGVGLWMRARVDGAIRRHPVLGTIYEQIKRGTIASLSVGGFFKRGLGALANKIVGVDVTEISATAVPAMAPGASGTSFAVAAGKALGHDAGSYSSDVGIVRQELAELRARIAVLRLQIALS